MKVFIRIYIQKFFNESLVKLQAWVTKMPPMSISHRMNWQHLKNDPKMAYHLCPITKFCGHVSANNNQSWANPKLNTLVLKVPNFYTCLLRNFSTPTNRSMLIWTLLCTQNIFTQIKLMIRYHKFFFKLGTY